MAARAAAAAGAVRSVLARGEGLAARLQRLIISARQYAAAAQASAKPQKRRGGSGDFWQFRPYQPGEDADNIDWRRSARDDSLYIRDKEQESAQTVAVIPDLSGSMLYRSAAAQASKEERALLWLFALAQLAAANGDKVMTPGLLPPGLDRKIAETLAAALLDNAAYPAQSGLSSDFSAVPRFAHIVLISDFLAEPAQIEAVLQQPAEREARISLIHIADPAERDFPFRGDMLLQDPETGAELYFSGAQDLRSRYQQIYQQHMEAVAAIARKFQARLMFDSTDTKPEQHLAELAALLRHD